jgi:fatty acid desaturase
MKTIEPTQDPTRIWTEYAGRVSLATLGLAALVAVAYPAIVALALTGTISYGAAVIPLILVGYVAFTPAHEAAHGNIFPEPSRQWLGDLIGWVMASLVLAPYPAFKSLHLRHHEKVNQGDLDPDFWVAGDGFLNTLARCLTILPHYYFVFLTQIGGENAVQMRRRRQSVVYFAAAAASVWGLIEAGWGREVFFLWLLPMLLATALLALVFDWMPHWPHERTGRYTHARCIVAPGLETLTFGHSLHLIHHLWPRVPYNHYGRVFRRVRTHLEDRGAPVADLRPTRGRRPAYRPAGKADLV